MTKPGNKRFDATQDENVDPDRTLACGVIGQAMQDINTLHRAMVKRRIRSTLSKEHRYAYKHETLSRHYRDIYFVGWDAVLFCVADSHKGVRELWCDMLEIEPSKLAKWLMVNHPVLYNDALQTIIF